MSSSSGNHHRSRRGNRDEDDHHHDDVRYRGSSRKDRSRSRSRSPSPQRKRTKQSPSAQEEARKARMARLRAENEEEERRLAAPSTMDSQHTKRPQPTEGIVQVNPDELEGLDEDEQMRRLLGFSGGFGSTTGQKVDDNHESAATGAAAKNKARKYRQYMNRKSGFNRPLDKMD